MTRTVSIETLDGHTLELHFRGDEFVNGGRVRKHPTSKTLHKPEPAKLYDIPDIVQHRTTRGPERLKITTRGGQKSAVIHTREKPYNQAVLGDFGSGQTPSFIPNHVRMTRVRARQRPLAEVRDTVFAAAQALLAARLARLTLRRDLLLMLTPEPGLTITDFPRRDPADWDALGQELAASLGVGEQAQEREAARIRADLDEGRAGRLFHALGSRPRTQPNQNERR